MCVRTIIFLKICIYNMNSWATHVPLLSSPSGCREDIEAESKDEEDEEDEDDRPPPSDENNEEDEENDKDVERDGGEGWVSLLFV